MPSSLCDLARRVAFALVALSLAVDAAAKPRYVESPPLDKVVTTPVGEVAGGSTLQVPIITWGADIATILANGNAERTAKGSDFAAKGLDLSLVREDKFPQQLASYLSGKSPYLRGTMGMLNMAAVLLSRDPRTRPVVIYQLSWSAGGDALVVKPGIHSAKDLKGKTIALQAYGPHVDYLSKILADAGLSPKDVTIRWLPDLTGTGDTPMAALHEPDVDAAFVITPDALALTSNGTVGTGAEDSVRGARVLLSTKTANRIIADVYAVRADYFAAHSDQVQTFVKGLMEGQDQLKRLMADKQSPAYRDAMGAAAEILLDSRQAVSDVEGLYADAELVGPKGNQDFFANPDYPRSFQRLTREIQGSFTAMGLLEAPVSLEQTKWDYAKLGQGLTAGATTGVRFDSEQVAAVVARRQQQGTLAAGEIFSFEIFFKPNQNSFSVDLYKDAFDKVIDLASTYGGALITIEGHSDPMGYLRKKQAGESELVLGRIKQSAKNLSLSRAVAVRDAIVTHAKSAGISLDPSQLAVVGHGIADPKSGLCGTDPCAPKSEREWRDNMRVEFRVIQVEAEESVFRPL
jgi:ABC-type nitrate/sulfonate/bicarbonate transport system substrate-binding protein/outer membrane protein OmpA-like peptidoglycan-associated protein